MDCAPLGISLNTVGKRYGRQWILRGIDFHLAPGGLHAILGANGSGKSTLLRMMCAFDRPSEGRVEWSAAGVPIDAMALPMRVAYCAPDQSLVQDLSVEEHIRLHQSLRYPTEGCATREVVDLARLTGKENTRVRELSSGMRQRLALALAFSTAGAAIFLDEPTSHLDREGQEWYRSLISGWGMGRTIVVASNHNSGEYPGAAGVFDISSGHI